MGLTRFIRHGDEIQIGKNRGRTVNKYEVHTRTYKINAI